MTVSLDAQIISAKRWQITDSTTGEVKSGCTLYSASPGNEQNPNNKGLDIGKFSFMSLSPWQKIHKVPALYKIYGFINLSSKFVATDIECLEK